MRGDEAGAARRRGPDALRRLLPRRAHLRPQRGGGAGAAAAGAQHGRPKPPAEHGLQPDGDDRGPGRGAGAAAGLGRRRHAFLPPLDAGERLPAATGAGRAQPVLGAVDGVRELGPVAGDLGLQPARRRLPPAFRRRRRWRRRRGVRARGGGVRARRHPRRRRLRHFELLCVIDGEGRKRRFLQNLPDDHPLCDALCRLFRGRGGESTKFFLGQCQS